jgi:hypothetical protein
MIPSSNNVITVSVGLFHSDSLTYTICESTYTSFCYTYRSSLCTLWESS